MKNYYNLFALKRVCMGALQDAPDQVQLDARMLLIRRIFKSMDLNRADLEEIYRVRTNLLSKGWSGVRGQYSFKIEEDRKEKEEL